MAARVAIRLRTYRELRADDYLLLFSGLALTAATAFLYHYTSQMFLMARLTFNPSLVFEIAASEAGISQDIRSIQWITWTYLGLSWTVIFFVKFAFLSLFHHLVDKLPGLYNFWKGALAIAIVVYLFTLCAVPLSCPRPGFDARKVQIPMRRL